MSTRLEIATRRESHITKMSDQLKVWTTELDDLIAGTIAAGAQTHDPYRIRLAGLRTAVGAVQARLDEFKGPSGGGGAWGPFRSGLKDELSALDEGFKDLRELAH
jgi:hypothetical protein